MNAVTLIGLGFTIISQNPLIAEKSLPEVSSWSVCPPPYYWFDSAGVTVEIDGTEVHTHFWERRDFRYRYFLVHDCESTGQLEKLLSGE